MSNAIACPCSETLRDYLLGCTPEPDQSGIEEHLAGCPHCQQMALPADDTFVSEFRQAASQRRPANPVVDQLIARVLARMNRPGEETVIEGDMLQPGDKELAVEALLERLGGYRVVSVLGKGGMGIVYHAHDDTLNRPVALKVIHPGMANGDARERFLREARLAASVTHDNVVPVLHVGEQDGVPFLAMPLLLGESLEARLKRERKLPLAEALRIAAEAAEGLAAAHARGLMHRDVKPANLWLEESTGRVKVLDFGLARPIQGDEGLTMTGAIVGTPAYMAPEQAGKLADHRADLFGLGATLYRMLTGELPFKGDTPLDILASVARDTPKPPRALDAKIPAAVSAYVMRLLEKHPPRRPVSAREVADELNRLRSEKSPTGTAWVKWIAAGLVGAVLLAGVMVLTLTGPDGGTVSIETDDDDIKVEVTQVGKTIVILDRKGKQQATIKAGTYDVELKNDTGTFTLESSDFTLKRGGKMVVRVTRKRHETPGESAREGDSLFDGKSLNGWEGDRKVWSVADGCIVGDTMESPTMKHTYLFTKKEFGDFEMRVNFKLLGDRGQANSGIQIRSKRGTDFTDMVGYQADIGDGYWGVLYDQSRRGLLSGPEQDAVRKAIKYDDWNDYTIRCEGPRIRLWLNGILTTDYIEKDDKIERRGVIGLQVHSNAKMKVLYRKIQIRELASGSFFPAENDVTGVKLAKPDDLVDVKSTPAPRGAVILFGGKSLDKWQTADGGEAKWSLFPGGIVRAADPDISTKQQFSGKFKLHVEFRIPYEPTRNEQWRGNSGVFLPGNHEVQILDSYGQKRIKDDCGAIYGVAPAMVNACKAPGVWQSYDIEYTSPVDRFKPTREARLTIYQNGVMIHDNLKVTPAAPGPIRLQWHRSPVEFRNIWLIQDTK